ncbi:MAG TPA: hypothetical protein VGK87_02720, partial [Anaerolineae bacterium]
IFISGLIAASSTVFASQANVALSNSDAQYSYIHANDWTLRKTVGSNNLASGGNGSVAFNISATKTSGETTFTVHGGLTVTNTGSTPATSGNIVVNLQKPNTEKLKKVAMVHWISIATDVADATSGDGATKANIVAAGSEESQPYNAAFGAGNYAVNGARGTFVETADSGKLEFTDASNNTIRSLVPQITIPAGQSVTLLYSAGFSATALPVAGTPLRVEALVSFGNSTGNGNSATAKNIDISGDGKINADEAKVLSIRSGIEMSALPSDPYECYDEVMVSDSSDDSVAASGTVALSNPEGFGSSTVNESASFNVSIDYYGGTDGGHITNTAFLDAEASPIQSLNVVVGQNADGTSKYATYQDCSSLHQKASARFDVTISNRPAFARGDFTTFAQGAWGGTVVTGNHTASTNPASILDGKFYVIYPDRYVQVGNSGGFYMEFTSPDAVRAYLPAAGPADALNADLVDPTDSHSGAFGGQVLALQLNVDFNRASISQRFDITFGDLKLVGTGTSLDGFTVSQVLAVSNKALGGLGLPSGFNYVSLSNLVGELNSSFDSGIPDAWSQTHLMP